MRRTLIATLCALAACAPADDGGDAARGRSPLAGGPPVRMEDEGAREGGILHLVRGDTAVVTVRFERTGTTLLSEVMGGPAEGRVAYTADLNRNGTVSRLQARLFARREDTEPAGRMELSVRGDSMALLAIRGNDTVRDTVGIEAGALPIPVAEDLAMVEQLLRRARARNRPTVHLPIVTLEGGARRGTATVEFMGRDSARITFRVRSDSAAAPADTTSAPDTTAAAAADTAGTTELFAATDSVGRLLGGHIPRRGVRIRREQ